MARSKSSISTYLAPFRRQAYQSWYLDGYSVVQFTKWMDVLFEELEKITFYRHSASERHWRTCKTVWENVWNIKGGGIPQEAPLGLEGLHVWFCKSPSGAIIWKPLGLDSLTLATLLPGLAMAFEAPYLAGQPLSLNQTWDDTGDDGGCVREDKPQPSYFKSATSKTNQQHSQASLSETHVPNAHDGTLVSYSQPAETNISREEVHGNNPPYSQLSDRSCVLTGQAVSETAASTHHIAPYCTMSHHPGTILSPDGPAKDYAEWPESVTQGCQGTSSNNLGFDLCSEDASQFGWLADTDF